MGSWGYQPREGDSPHDMEHSLHVKSTAPYLIKLFKEPLAEGSIMVVRRDVLNAKAKKLGGRKVLRTKSGRAIASSFKAWSHHRRMARKEILKENGPASFCEIHHASHDRWNRLGMVQILNEKGISIPISVVKKCRAYLKALAKDEGFADGWRDPAEFVKTVQTMLEYVEDTISQDADFMKRCKKARRGPALRKGPRMVHGPVLRDVPGDRKRARPGKNPKKRKRA